MTTTNSDAKREVPVASFLELSRSALAQNVATYRALEAQGGSGSGPSRRLGAVLKGNAYGHGFAQMLPLVHPQVDVLYVIAPDDALAVRAFEALSGAPRKQVLVLGAIAPHEAVALAREGIDAVIGDADWAPVVARLRAEKAGAPLRVHVHLDTGLGREGFTPEQLSSGALALIAVVPRRARGRRARSATSRTPRTSPSRPTRRGSSRSSRPASPACARSSACRESCSGTPPPRAASMVLPAARYEALRVGISLYGLWPSPETRLSARLVLGHVPELHPVLSWRCPSQTVKWLPAGSFVGYGCTYRCAEATRVAVLPVGYFDGYPRLLSGRAYVLVNGRRCPVLGRVMMNHVIVDVTRATQDERPILATLIGRDGDDALSVEQLAKWADTINYELATRLGPHLRREVVACGPEMGTGCFFSWNPRSMEFRPKNQPVPICVVSPRSPGPAPTCSASRGRARPSRGALRSRPR